MKNNKPNKKVKIPEVDNIIFNNGDRIKMKWIKGKVFSWIKEYNNKNQYELKEDIRHEVDHIINDIIENISKGNYLLCYRTNANIINDFNDIIRKIVKDHAKEDINKIIENLNINKESFIDEIVQRILNKQMR